MKHDCLLTSIDRRLFARPYHTELYRNADNNSHLVVTVDIVLVSFFSDEHRLTWLRAGWTLQMVGSFSHWHQRICSYYPGFARLDYYLCKKKNERRQIVDSHNHEIDQLCKKDGGVRCTLFEVTCNYHQLCCRSGFCTRKKYKANV